MKKTYVFFNKYHDVFRIKASSLSDAIKAIPRGFFYEFFEVYNTEFSGVKEE